MFLSVQMCSSYYMLDEILSSIFIPVVCSSPSGHSGGYWGRRRSQCCSGMGNLCHHVHCMYLHGHYTDTCTQRGEQLSIKLRLLLICSSPVSVFLHSSTSSHVLNAHIAFKVTLMWIQCLFVLQFLSSTIVLIIICTYINIWQTTRSTVVHNNLKNISEHVITSTFILISSDDIAHSLRFHSRRHHSLLALPLQQEVATKAALTLVPHTVVLATHTHGILFCGTLRHPVLNLMKGKRRVE